MASYHPLSGSCACSAITFTAVPDAAAVPLNYCHCTVCRQTSGSAFLPFVNVPTDSVHFSGEGLRTFKATPYAERLFCAACGGQLGMKYLRRPERFYLTLGTVDESTYLLEHETEQEQSGQIGADEAGAADGTKVVLKYKAHIFVGEKAKWYPREKMNDGVPQKEKMEGSDWLVEKEGKDPSVI